MNKTNDNGSMPPGKGAPYDPAQVVSFLDLLDHASVGGITEVRCLFDRAQKIKGRWTGKAVVGYYEPSHYEQAANDIAALDGRANIYVTANPVKPDLLARAKNRLQFDAKHSAKDEDILRRLWLLGDIDPLRASGISSTDAELQAAIEVRDVITAEFVACGFDVLTGNSGNGAHFMVRIDEAAKSEIVSSIVAELSLAYRTEDVGVDTTVSNASRIWKCYGTLACKGDDLPERPHRRADLDEVATKPRPRDLSHFPIFLDAQETKPVTAPSYTMVNGSKSSNPWASGAVARTLQKLSSVPDGEKHKMLLRAASNLGGFIHTGVVTREEVEDALIGALGGRAKNEKNARKTIRDGIKWGESRPHSAPPVLPGQRVESSPIDHDYSPSNEQPEAPSDTPQPPRFPRLTLSQVFARPRLEYLIQGIFVERGTGVISADYGGFKSLIALDMGLCVAMGRYWMGKATKRGSVVYITPEGSYQHADRVKAWMKFHGIAELPENFEIIELPVQIGDATQCQLLTDELRDLNPAFIILDTVAKCNIGREENDAGAMGLFTDGMEKLARELGAFVLAIHHNNKSGTARGSVSLPANVDASVTLKRSPGRVVTIGCDRVKGAPFDEFSLIGRIIETGEVDENAAPVTSLVFELTDKPPTSVPQADQTKEMVLDVLRKSEVALSAGDWEKLTGLSRSRFGDFRKILLTEKLVTQTGRFYVALSDSSDSDESDESDTPKGMCFSSDLSDDVYTSDGSDKKPSANKKKGNSNSNGNSEPYQAQEIREGAL